MTKPFKLLPYQEGIMLEVAAKEVFPLDYLNHPPHWHAAFRYGVDLGFTKSSERHDTLVKAIQGHLRIKDLWMPNDNWSGEHEGEAQAICSSRNALELALTQYLGPDEKKSGES